MILFSSEKHLSPPYKCPSIYFIFITNALQGRERNRPLNFNFYFHEFKDIM